MIVVKYSHANIKLKRNLTKAIYENDSCNLLHPSFTIGGSSLCGPSAGIWSYREFMFAIVMTCPGDGISKHTLCFLTLSSLWIHFCTVSRALGGVVNILVRSKYFLSCTSRKLCTNQNSLERELKQRAIKVSRYKTNV